MAPYSLSPHGSGPFKDTLRGFKRLFSRLYAARSAPCARSPWLHLAKQLPLAFFALPTVHSRSAPKSVRLSVGCAALHALLGHGLHTLQIHKKMEKVFTSKATDPSESPAASACGCPRPCTAGADSTSSCLAAESRTSRFRVRLFGPHMIYERKQLRAAIRLAVVLLRDP